MNIAKAFAICISIFGAFFALIYAMATVVTGETSQRLALHLKLHPTNPATRFEAGDPVIAARAAALSHELRLDALRSHCFRLPDADALDCALRQEEAAVRRYLDSAAVRSPAFAWAMAGLASEMEFAVPPAWQSTYAPLAVATTEMVP